jgi:hypothetical protein
MHYNLACLKGCIMKTVRVCMAIGAIMLIPTLLVNHSSAQAHGLFQQPTGSVPTVTSTPMGVTVRIPLSNNDPTNLRSGPGVFFDQVGIMLPGQEFPALGRSAGGDWVMLEYIGAPNNVAWVYSPLVIISPGELPIIEPPSTPTPMVTETIDPTLAAQFITTPNPTRLPTFTPAEPLVLPTYEDLSQSALFGQIPMGLIIVIIGGIGGIMMVFSHVRTR